MKGLKKNEPLSKYSPLNIGGPADLFLEAKTVDELVSAVKEARKDGIPVTVLGDATNVLISDAGIRGLVVKNSANEIEILDEKGEAKKGIKPVSRWESDTKSGTFKGIEFKDLDYDEFDKPRGYVIADSGVKLSNLMRYTIERGLTGLQWYSGIPGTIGGAVFNNIHGGTHFISEVIDSVQVLTPKGEVKWLTIEELGVDYDKSRFHDSGEIILRVKFALYKGDVEKAKYVAKEWAKRKAIQPRNSPGCAFANITQEDKKRLNYPTTSTGYIVDQILNIGGFKIGGAKVYEDHKNFIVNEKSATAKDYLAVMKEIHKRAKEECGIDLVPEIFLLGFKPKEVGVFYTPHQQALRKKRNEEIKTIYQRGDAA